METKENKITNRIYKEFFDYEGDSKGSIGETLEGSLARKLFNIIKRIPIFNKKGKITKYIVSSGYDNTLYIAKIEYFPVNFRNYSYYLNTGIALSKYEKDIKINL